MAFLSRTSVPPLPPQLVDALLLAPPGAKYMKASLSYSVERKASGLIFEGWRDENFKSVPPREEKPPFHMVIPAAVGEHYFQRLRGALFFPLEDYGYASEE